MDFVTPTDTGIVIHGDLELDGTMTMLNGIVQVAGSWDRGTTGIFNEGDGTIVFNGTGLKTLDNGNTSFNNLEVEMNGTLQIANNTYIDNNFSISSGTFDVTATNYKVYVGGDYSNNGTLEARSGTIILNSASGTNTIYAGTSTYYNVEIDAGTTQYNMSGDWSISRNFEITEGILNLNSNILNFGDGSGSDILSIDNGGVLLVNENAELKFESTAAIEVNSGGIVKIVGTDDDNQAKVTNQGSGRYSFDVNSGGTIHAQYYVFEYMNSDGVYLKSGALVDATENFSDGTFLQGASDGRFLLLEHNIIADDTVRNIYFSLGPPINVKRISGTNPAIFKDAFGVRSGYYFEDDDEGTSAPSTGLVQWVYSSPTLTWTGDGTNNVWDNAQNWNPNGVPTASTNIFLPNTGDSIPLINASVSGNALASNITIYSGGKLIISDDKDLTITENLSGDGTLEISNASATSIIVGDKWDNIGLFEHGGNSTVEFTAESGNININTGGNPFYNLKINSGGAANAVFQTSSSIDVDGNLEITSGTFKIAHQNHQLEVGGNWTNNGTFIHGDNTVTFNGTGAQSITTTEDFYNLTISGSGTKSLSNNITIEGELNIVSTLSPGSATIDVKGEFINSGTFNYGTSTVKFSGSESQTINGGTFYNLYIDNSSALTAISLSNAITIVPGGTFTLKDGIVATTGSDIITISDGAGISHIGGDASYISGPMNRIGSSDFVFPIGKRPYYARIAVSDFSGVNTFKAEYFRQQYSDLTIKPGLNSVSDNEYWTLDRTSGTGTPKVKLHWEDNIASEISEVTALTVAAYDNSNTAWESQGQSANTVSGSTGDVTSANNVTLFGPYTFGYSYTNLTWTGNNSTSWNDVDNWGGSQIPSSTTNLIIPDVSAGSGNNPVMDGDYSIFDLSVENGGQFIIDNNNSLTISGSVDIQTGGTFQINDGSISTISVVGNWSVDGTFTCGNSSTTEFTGEYDQSIGASTFNSITIDGSQTKSLAGNIIINGNLVINNNGTLDASTHTIDLKGNWDNDNGGSFNAQTGTVQFSGTSNQLIYPSASESFQNFTINYTGVAVPHVTLQGNLTVVGHLELTDGIVNFANSANYLAIGTAGSASSGSNDSHVSGQMRKFGDADFTFPVGKGAIWARLGISNLGTSGTFSSEYYNEPYSDVSNMGTDMHHVSIVEYWDLSRRSGTGEPKVTLHWEDTSYNFIDDASKLAVAHYMLGHWEDEGNTSFYWNDAPPLSDGYVISDNLTSFSPITFGVKDGNESANPLPIELLSFTGVQKENGIELSWATASEYNNDYFTIEQSSDGINFEGINEIQGAGYSNTINSYISFDDNPVVGTNYYRLQQNDFDGAISYSNIITVEYEQRIVKTISNIEAILYPNPTVDGDINIILKGNPDQTVELKIIDIYGKEYFRKEVCFYGSNQALVSIKEALNLNSGIYFVFIIDDKSYTKAKLIIK